MKEGNILDELNLTRLDSLSMPRNKLPRFCRQEVARKLMMTATCIAIVINIPYCFMFRYNDHGELVTTNFFQSW